MAAEAVVILGGGVGGLVTANELRKRLGKEHRVILVDRDGRHVFWPSLPWLQVGLRTPEGIVRDLASLEKKGIEVVKGQVERIDPDRKVVEVNGTELEADYLVIPSVPSWPRSRSPAWRKPATISILWTGLLPSATLARVLPKATWSCWSPECLSSALQRPTRLCCWSTTCRKLKVGDNVSVALYSPEPGPMMVTGPELSEGVKQLVKERDISYYPQHQVTEVDPATGTLSFANGAETRFDFLVYIAPHVAPPVVREAELTGKCGWVPVDRQTMETQFPGVYAIGDVTGIPLSMGLPLPKAGVFAHREGEGVAQTIAAHITGRGQEAPLMGMASAS